LHACSDKDFCIQGPILFSDRNGRLSSAAVAVAKPAIPKALMLGHGMGGCPGLRGI
jgi:hypothetical protein